jgi:hypothetical protein
MQRFTFDLESVSGLRVSKISILAADEERAKAKLNQMYPRCRILNLSVGLNAAPVKATGTLGHEDLLDLLSRKSI